MVAPVLDRLELNQTVEVCRLHEIFGGLTKDNRIFIVYDWRTIYTDLCRKYLLYLSFYGNYYYFFGFVQVK